MLELFLKLYYANSSSMAVTGGSQCIAAWDFRDGTERDGKGPQSNLDKWTQKYNVPTAKAKALRQACQPLEQYGKTFQSHVNNVHAAANALVYKIFAVEADVQMVLEQSIKAQQQSVSETARRHKASQPPVQQNRSRGGKRKRHEA